MSLFLPAENMTSYGQHEFSAEQPEECYALLYRYHLGYENMLLDRDMKRWREWFYSLTQGDMTDIYKAHKQQLQLIGYQGES